MFFEAYRKAATGLFADFVDRYIKGFEPLNIHLMHSNMGILLRTWISIIFFSTLLAYIISFITVLLVNIVFTVNIVIFIYLIIFVPILTAALTFLVFYLYPIQKSRSIEKSIEVNLPFALAHMSAIASSGIPPEFMFELLLDFKEYGDISLEAKNVVRNIKTFGMSSVRAMADVAEKTPSTDFQEVLLGMVATIERGGDLVGYLKGMSDKALFDYKLKRERYLKTLSTYADIYTALLVAAPLLMLAVLGVMSILGGEIMGFSIQELILLITWVGLPFMNIAFIAFIHMTHPGV